MLKRAVGWVLVVVLLFLLVSCAQATPEGTLTPAATLIPTATQPPKSAVLSTATPAQALSTSTLAAGAAPHADVVITPAQSGIETVVKVGQVIQIQAMPERDWEVAYSADLLTSLTPADQMKNPGANGWYFKVTGPGNTQITLTSIAKPCPGGSPCKPNIMRLTFPIHAQP